MKLRLNIDGKAYEVEVEVLDENLPPRGGTPTAVQSASAGPIAANKPSKSPTIGPIDDSKALTSPISGVVVRIPIQVGQEVKTNDTVMVLEAMKMETVITSQCDGKIARIHPMEGDAVQVKQVLVEFE